MIFRLILVDRIEIRVYQVGIVGDQMGVDQMQALRKKLNYGSAEIHFIYITQQITKFFVQI